MSYFDTIYASELPSRAINVYRYLFDRANKKRQCFPSIRRIASDLHISTSTVYRALGELEAAGFIRRQHRFRKYKEKEYGKTSNLYTIYDSALTHKGAVYPSSATSDVSK